MTEEETNIPTTSEDISEGVIETPEELDKKDITSDIIISIDREEEEKGAPARKGDHPAIVILDMALDQSGIFLQSQNLPAPNTAVYEHFSKPFLNTALWHYLPDGTLPDDPRVALLLGIGGLALAFSPTLIALYRKSNEKKEKAEAKVEAKEERKEEQKENTSPKVHEESNAPDWMTRLESLPIPGV